MKKCKFTDETVKFTGKSVPNKKSVQFMWPLYASVWYECVFTIIFPTIEYVIIQVRSDKST